jgi:sugar (pentulose or hexulose) kinase
MAGWSLMAASAVVAMTYARVADELHPAAPRVVEVAAAGRVSNDQSEWLQVLADVLGRPVTRVTRPRATQRGTALLALDVLAPDVTRATGPPERHTSPGPRTSSTTPDGAAVRRGVRPARALLRGPGTSNFAQRIGRELRGLEPRPPH